MKNKIIPSPYVHKTERTDVSIIMHWMRNIIEEKNIDLGPPDVETSGDDRKMPDTVIYESKRSQKVICVIEAKPPYFDVFNEKELKEPAWKKAVNRKAKYFATTNFQRLIWFNTEKVNEQKPEEEQIIDKFILSEIKNLDDIEHTRFQVPIKKALEDFLLDLYEVYNGKKSEPKLAIDELLIFRLQEKIKVLSDYYRRIIDDECHKDKNFRKKLAKWFFEQGWEFTWDSKDFEKSARQTAYLLVNKILFYDLLQSKRPQELSPLEIPEGLLKGKQLKKMLQMYFDDALEIDYETVFTTDFIDTIAFPEAKEIIHEIRELINVLNKYDFSKIGYDIIGRIFEKLIPQNERHFLGQYFTSPDVVDLILNFCMYHEDDKVLDPSCGAGTFLVRAYNHKKLLNQRMTHEKILDKLWGNDIAKFPATLATINLAINDLSVEKNYPNILQEDFFEIHIGEDGFNPENWREKRAKTLKCDEREVIYPRWFDCVVGNPPYTRQEEMSEISPDDIEYKESLIRKAILDLKGKEIIADIVKRAGIHAYFFVHGIKFLKDGGYFGFIVSNSWLDVDYGKGLQEFFLKNYKILTIIDSKVERWFEDADINTCIVILQKCNDKKERDNNLVRFVYLKKPLREFIPPAQDMWEKQKERIDKISDLKKTILFPNEYYENEDLRIYPISQKELWEEGYDSEKEEFSGAKWGKYIRAPGIFFKILEKGKDILVPLKNIADVRRGFTTGANEFFYLTEEEITRRGIEKEYWMHKDEKGDWIPNYVIKSPRECTSIIVNPENLKYRVLMIHKDKKDLKGTKILQYIKEGERKGFHERPTCASRKRWYDLGLRDPFGFLHPMVHNDRQLITNNKYLFYVDHNLFEIKPQKKDWLIPLMLFFVSTPSIIIKELGGRVNLGEGALKTEGIDIDKLLSINIKCLKEGTIIKLLKWYDDNENFQHFSCFTEIGTDSPNEVTIEKIKDSRRDLDKIVMGEILGLSEEEQLEVYRAVIDLIKSRIDKAKSVKNNNKTNEGINIKSFVETVMEKIGDESLGNYYRNRILSLPSLSTIILPKLKNKVDIIYDVFGIRVITGKEHIKCDSEDEARYIKTFIEAGLEELKIPENKEFLKSIAPELEKKKIENDEIINSYIETILSRKTREQLKHHIWAEIMK